MRKTVTEPQKNISTKIETTKVTSCAPLLESIKNDIEHERLLIEWIEKGTFNADRYEEMPHLRASQHTRNIILFDKKEKHYIVLNGGRHRSMSPNGRDITSAPVSNTKYKYVIAGQPISRLYNKRGKKIERRDQSPAGGYNVKTLLDKIIVNRAIEDRMEEAISFGKKLFMLVPIYTAAIRYKQEGSQTEYGAGVYVIPSMQAKSKFERALMGSLGIDDSEVRPYDTVFSTNVPQIAIMANYMAIASLFIIGYIHPQNHTENRYLHITESTKQFVGILTDMEDVYDINDHPDHSNYSNSDLIIEGNSTDFQVSPKGKALLHALTRSIECDVVSYVNRFHGVKDLDEDQMVSLLQNEILGPIERSFIAGITLAGSSIDQMGNIKFPQSILHKDIGIILNGKAISLRSELKRLARYMKIVNEQPSNSIFKKKLLESATIIGAITAKDIVSLIDTDFIQNDTYSSHLRLEATQTLDRDQLHERKMKPKKEKKKRRRHKPKS